MSIAADLCVYTNHNFIMEVLDKTGGENAKWVKRDVNKSSLYRQVNLDEETQNIKSKD